MRSSAFEPGNYSRYKSHHKIQKHRLFCPEPGRISASYPVPYSGIKISIFTISEILGFITKPTFMGMWGLYGWGFFAAKSVEMGTFSNLYSGV